MGSEDFIDLDPSSDSDDSEEKNDMNEANISPSEADCGTSTSLMKEDILVRGSNLETFGENAVKEESQGIKTMDLEVDSVQERSVIKGSIDIAESVVMENLNEIQPGKDIDNACVLTTNTSAKNLLIDESPTAGVKRARTTYVDQQPGPSVRVVFKSLTRESKKKLMELMQQWSEHAQLCDSSSNVSSKEVLEDGEETYFPALHVGSEKTSTVSFWVDTQVRKDDIRNMKLDDDSVPLYDRGYTLGSTLVGGSAIPDRIETLEAPRCFNCGSYGHSLRECTRPRDNVAINSARKQHSSIRKTSQGSRGQVRYYQKSPGKFDGLKAGVLGPETRESMGIGELDPPPWLCRMREMGYPPGYLDDVEDEDQPSGITIFADEETKEFEDGELPEKGEAPRPEKKMSVEFPGINAPFPENADHDRWNAALTSSRSNRSHHRSNRLSDSHRGLSGNRQRTDIPPGTDYRPGSERAGYSPRYGNYDHNSPLIPRSPILGRSLSDRGWQNPVGYEGSQSVHSPHSPYPYSTASRQLPAHQYHSPSASLEQRSHDWAYGAGVDVSSQQQAARDNRHDAHYHHHPDQQRRHHRS